MRGCGYIVSTLLFSFLCVSYVLYIFCIFVVLTVPYFMYLICMPSIVAGSNAT